MRLIQGPRRSGKTQELVVQAKLDPDSLIVVADEARARDLVSRGVPREQVSVAGRLESRRGRGMRCDVHVDDVQAVLAALLGLRVGTVTLDTSALDSTLDLAPLPPE